MFFSCQQRWKRWALSYDALRWDAKENSPRKSFSGVRQVLYVIAISLDVSFELRQREVVWIEGADPEMLVSPREHFGEPLFVVLRHPGHTHVIQVHLVLFVKRAAPDAKFKQRCALFSWGDEQHVEVGSRPCNPNASLRLPPGRVLRKRISMVPALG